MEENILIQKLINYREDPISWIMENVKILHQAHGIIPFKMYDFQKNVINTIINEHFVITLKSRQVGMSTIMQAYCLYLCMFYNNYEVVVISTGQKAATDFLDKIKFIYENIENDELKMEIESSNKSTLVFTNGSRINAVPATDSATRGQSINLLVIDEAAHINGIQQIYMGVYPTLSRAFKTMTGKPYGIAILSTPLGISGKGKWYYDMYNSAINKRNKYVPIRIHWSEVDEYDENWYIDQCKQLNWDYTSINSELELSFVSSGETYIPNNLLSSIKTTKPKIKLDDNALWIWENPEENIQYVMGVDVSYGTGKDFSTIQIINPYTLEQAVEFCDPNIKIDDFAKMIIKLAKKYNCLVNIERNAVGKVLIERIIEKTGNVGINLYKDYKQNSLIGTNKFEGEYGTLVTGSNRDMLLSNMYNVILDMYLDIYKKVNISDESISDEERVKILLEGKKKEHIDEDHKKEGIIKSERLLYQLLGFTINDNGRASGDKDDLVLAYTHALYCYSKTKKLLLKDIEKINNAFNYKDKEFKDKYVEFLYKGELSRNSSVFKDMKYSDFEKLIQESDVDLLKIKINDDEKNIDEESLDLINMWENF